MSSLSWNCHTSGVNARHCMSSSGWETTPFWTGRSQPRPSALQAALAGSEAAQPGLSLVDSDLERPSAAAALSRPQRTAALRRTGSLTSSGRHPATQHEVERAAPACCPCQLGGRLLRPSLQELLRRRSRGPVARRNQGKGINHQVTSNYSVTLAAVRPVT